MRVLVVERSAEDIAILHRRTRQTGCAIAWTFVRDGEEAIDWLSRTANDSTRTPDVILLAINLPKLSGLEVLAHLKQTPELRCIPVVMYTGSTREEDMVRAYDAGACLYVEKSPEQTGFCKLVEALEQVCTPVAA